MKPQLVTAALALATLAEAPARAEPPPPTGPERLYLPPRVPSPAPAVELTVASGYTQGFGMLEPGIGMPQVASAGLGVEASVGYRIDPRFGFSVGGQYSELEAEQTHAARAFALTLALQYHIAPTARVDPWLELGSGYRLLWLVPFEDAPTSTVHGPQLVRARTGLDIRVTPDVAIAPVIGADAMMFVFRDDGEARAIREPTVSTFVYAGLLGRIDIGVSKRALPNPD